MAVNLSFHRFWRPRFHRPNPPPIEPREQRFELNAAQRRQTIRHRGPTEVVLFQALVGNDETRAISVEQLQPIGLLGPEHKDRAGEWVLVQRSSPAQLGCRGLCGSRSA